MLSPEEIDALAIRLVESQAEASQRLADEWEEEWEAEEVGRTTDAIEAARAELAAVKEETAKHRALIEAHPWLDDIRAMVDGEITHLAVRERVMVGTVDEILTERDARKARLVTITPRTNRRWQKAPAWAVNTYSDGSGSDTPIVPCRSLEEAHDQVRAWFLADVGQFRYWVADGKKGSNLGGIWNWRKYLDSGVTLSWPSDLIDFIATTDRNEKAKAVRSASERLEAAQTAHAEGLDLPEPVPADTVLAPTYEPERF